MEKKYIKLNIKPQFADYFQLSSEKTNHFPIEDNIYNDLRQIIEKDSFKLQPDTYLDIFYLFTEQIATHYYYVKDQIEIVNGEKISEIWKDVERINKFWKKYHIGEIKKIRKITISGIGQKNETVNLDIKTQFWIELFFNELMMTQSINNDLAYYKRKFINQAHNYIVKSVGHPFVPSNLALKQDLEWFMEFILKFKILPKDNAKHLIGNIMAILGIIQTWDSYKYRKVKIPESNEREYYIKRYNAKMKA